MIVAEACNYAPFYGGNFINSLKSIKLNADSEGEYIKMIFIFPQEASSREWAKELEQTNVVLYIPKGRMSNNFNLAKICKKNNVDILHLHFYGLTSCFLVGWLTKTKVINHFHNLIDKQNLFHIMLNKFLSLKSTKLVGCSAAVMDTMLEYKFPHNKCTFITNCVDFDRLNVINESKFIFDKTKNNILIFGTFFYPKGVDIALLAIEPIVEKYNICLHIVSNCPNNTRLLVDKIVGPNHNWISFPPPTNNIGEYFTNSQILLSPSLSEGFCYANIEALYCKCMVIKSDIEGMHYHIKNEEDITINLTVENLRNKIESILHMSTSDRELLVSNLREECINKFNVNKWGKEVYYLYKSVINH